MKTDENHKCVSAYAKDDFWHLHSPISMLVVLFEWQAMTVVF